MKERRNDRREDSRLGSWSSAPRYMQLEWSCTGHAKSHGGGWGQSTWARCLADSPCKQDPPHPPPPTPRERPLVHDPGYLPGTDRAFPGSQAEVVKVPQHRRQVVHHATLTANSHTTLS